MKKLIKKISVLSCAALLIGGIGLTTVASARPVCMCDNPDIESWKIGKCTMRYHCKNCDWWTDWKYCK
ncbi:hypothetical protein [Clostridium ihumii]|uniref:hypothetical protein n=1 Tax=Clostridium ihumii TaxID=1470356 RepID=UPI00058B706F|nr:hypothetical protein [Clostridium ihumii]